MSLKHVGAHAGGGAHSMISSDDLLAMQGLAQALWRRHPEHVDMTVGELAYRILRSEGDMQS